MTITGAARAHLVVAAVASAALLGTIAVGRLNPVLSVPPGTYVLLAMLASAGYFGYLVRSGDARSARRLHQLDEKVSSRRVVYLLSGWRSTRALFAIRLSDWSLRRWERARGCTRRGTWTASTAEPRTPGELSSPTCPL
ncbi:hypothetical protein ACIBBG_32245 [Micromonospora chersina]|uniref:hypothetical protein n=1 Tax=Micromonospora chersina TaxID=47854 RepID=UPI0037B1198C